MKATSSQSIKRFNHLTGEIDAVYHSAAVKLGLSDSVMSVLYTMCDCGGSCQLADICRLTGLPKQTVNSAVRHLENGGFLHLEAVNARSKKAFLTEQGALLADKTAARIIQIENEIFDSWRSEEVEQYLHLTERYLAALKEKTVAL